MKSSYNLKTPIIGTTPGILIRILFIVSASILICYALVSVVFSSLGLSAFVNLEVSTMNKHCRYIATLTNQYFEKRMTDDRYLFMLGEDSNIWNASVYVFDASGNLVIRSDNNTTEKDLEAIAPYLDKVLSGEDVQVANGIITGAPVNSTFHNVTGAVFMIKPISDVYRAMTSIKDALRVAFVMAFLVVILPIYLVVSITLANPIKRMISAAEQMAAGDYKTIPDIKGNGELAVLGRSLNELSRSLNKTIGDLQAERNLLNEILSGMEDGVIAFDINMRMVRHNPAAARLLGGDDKLPYDSDVMRTIIDHIPQIEGDNSSVVFNTDCGDRLLHIRMNLIHSEQGKSFVLVLLHDATESARYEQSRRDYVANVSHELRTPVANIKNISEALCDGIVAQDELQKYYKHLYKESDRLSRLINDLLELSRMQSGKLSLSKRKTNLYEIILDVADRFSRTAQEAGRVLTADCPIDIPFVYTNEDRIEQVLIILIDNAVKHSESEEIIIRAETISASQITVSVINEGEIAEEDLPHLFERFYKADRSHSGGGSGLGLSIASEIMALLNEELWVTSENGIVTFAFTLSIFRNK